MLKIFAIALISTVQASAESAYPDLDDFQYVNYAETPQQVVYDYVDHQENQASYYGGSANYGGYDNYNNYNDNKYQMDEKPASAYDYSSRDYVVVEEGTTGTYEEKGGWSYEPSYNSYQGNAEVHHYREPRHERHDSYYDRGYDNRRHDDRHRDERRYDDRHNDYRRHDDRRHDDRHHDDRRQDRYYDDGKHGEAGSFVPIFIIVAVIIGCLAGCTYCKHLEVQREAERQKRIVKANYKLKVLLEAPVHAVDTQDQQPLFFTGTCTVDGPVCDARFNVQTMNHPMMFRKVESFQWSERKENVEERRGDQVRRGVKYHYKAEWGSTPIDSRSFKDQKYNQNVRPDIADECIKGGQVRIGQFYTVDLDELIMPSAFVLVPLKGFNWQNGLAATSDIHGIWSIDSKNNCLVRQRNPGKDTVGDIRVKYDVLDTFENVSNGTTQATVCGIPKGNKITRWDALNGVACKGQMSVNDFLNIRVS